MKNLHNLLVIIENGEIVIKDFSDPDLEMPDKAIQLDELLYGAIEDGILDRDDLKKLSDRSEGFVVGLLGK